MANHERKLATIQTIKSIDSIEGADRIDRARVMGWGVVVQKGKHEVGEKVVYFEIDSYLPIESKYEFLKDSYRNNVFMGEGYRLRTKKLRGVVSQGLIMSLADFDDKDLSNLEVGTDLTEMLNVKLYDVPENTSLGERTKSMFHPVISKTDEIRAQSDERYINELRGHPYYISEKVDGQSLTIVKEGEVVQVFMRNTEVLYDEFSPMWVELTKKGLIDLIKDSPEDIFIQGEWYGEGIQKNKLNIKGREFALFNVGSPITGEVYPFNKWNEIFAWLDPNNILKTVKILEVGDSFDYTLEELQDFSKGNYDNAGQREGIVIRPTDGRTMKNKTRLSFKVINNDFLIKHNL